MQGRNKSTVTNTLTPSEYKWSRIRRKGLPYALIAPTMFVFIAFMFYPLFYTVYLSLLDWNMVRPVKKFVGLSNYVAMFSDMNMHKIVGNTFLYIAILVLVNFVAPYIFSFILSVVIKKGKTFYKSSIFLPSVISLVVGSIIFAWILNPITGPVAQFLQSIGLEAPNWSRKSGLVIVVISLITSWKVFGYNLIVVMSGVAGVPIDVIESARLSGIPTWRIFLEIVVPMSSATGIYVLIIAIVQGLQSVFTPIKILTMGGPDFASSNLIFNVYFEGFQFFRTGVASAYAIVTMGLFVVLLFLEFKFVERSVYYEI